MNVKQQILLVICMFLTLSTQAQKLTVESMTMVVNDISASQYERKDLNGQACALVKVQLAAQGAKFEGNVIGQSEYKTGEYWVFMTEGSYMLSVKHPNFVPLDLNLHDYGIRSLKGKVTYKLTLLIPNNAVDGMHYLVLNVEPANSTVYIDEKIKQVVGGFARIPVNEGTHSYRVEAKGYATESGNILVENTDILKTIILKSMRSKRRGERPTNPIEVTEIEAELKAIEKKKLELSYYDNGINLLTKWEKDNAKTEHFIYDAIELLKEGSNSDPRCCYELGMIYYWGESNINTNYFEAAKWFEKFISLKGSGEGGNEYLLLGTIYNSGRYGLAKDEIKAMNYLKYGGNNEGNVNCYYALANLYAIKENKNVALDYIKKALQNNKDFKEWNKKDIHELIYETSALWYRALRKIAIERALARAIKDSTPSFGLG